MLVNYAEKKKKKLSQLILPYHDFNYIEEGYFHANKLKFGRKMFHDFYQIKKKWDQVVNCVQPYMTTLKLCLAIHD